MASPIAIRQTTDGFDVEDVLTVGYDESSLDLEEVPRFEFTVPNITQQEAYRLFVGKEVTIKRYGALAIPGIIEDVVPKQAAKQVTSHTVKGLHTGYAILQAKKLTNYDFDEDNNPATTRDGVTINPWNYFIFRAPNGTLGVDGLPPAVDGIPFETAMKACIGTRIIHQIDFQDNRYFLPSEVYATTDTIQVYRDGPQSQTRPALQRIRNGANFKSGVALNSIPLYAGSPNVWVAGTISTIDVLFIGKRDAGSNNIVVNVCRNGSAVAGSRTYTAVTLTYTANYLGSGLDAWSGSVDLSAGGESVKNVLGFKININGGTGTTDTTYVYCAKIIATTTTDTGITEGTIDAYDNPFTMNGAENWVETDLQGETALSGAERLRTLTASDPAVNTTPHWDAWIDGSLAFHFKERRGTTSSKVYSFAEENLTVIEHEYQGSDLRYQTIAYGPGSGEAQTRIVSKQAFTSGGLYDADRDWTVNPSTALYGRRARVGDFVDANEPSVVNLLRKAYADHKLHRVPIESIRASLIAEVLPYFTVGDSLPITNLPTRTNGTPRVIRMHRAFDRQNREKLDVTFGQDTVGALDRLQRSSEQAIALTYRIIPSEGRLGISGNGLYFDKDHYGIYSLPIQEGARIKRVSLRLGFLPWQATAKTLASGYLAEVDRTASPVSQNTTGVLNGGTTTHTYSLSTPTVGTQFRRFIISGTCGSGAAGNLFRLAGAASGLNDIWFDLRDEDGVARQMLTMPGNQIVDGGSVSVILNNFSGATKTMTSSLEYFDYVSSQPFVFGIYQFDGDSGDGTGGPIYGTGVTFAVDPTIAGSTGIPTGGEFSAVVFPATLGHSQTAPGTYEFDITGYLTTESNGLIKSGEHRIYFKGANATNNGLGLTVLSITPIFEFRSD